MKIIFSLSFAMILYLPLAGQNEGFPTLDNELQLILQPSAGLDTDPTLRMHIGTERFMSKFPNAPRWNHLGIQMPLRADNALFNLYLRHAREGIFQKIMPGIGYNYSFFITHQQRTKLDLGIGADWTINSINQQAVITTEPDPEISGRNNKFSTFRPMLNFGITHHAPISKIRFKADIVFIKGLGFNKQLIQAGRIIAEIPLYHELKLRTQIIESTTSRGEFLSQFILDLDFPDLFSIGTSYLTDGRYGVQMNLPLDLIYSENQLVCIGIKYLFQLKRFSTTPRDSYSLAIRYNINK